jgi:phage regulator Rha-like protein
MTTHTPRIEIQNLIYLIRSKKVMLDSDLAIIYGVKTKRLNEQMRRNIERFPADFMFQLNEKEWNNLRSQIATTNPQSEKRRSLPYVFTEHGTVMLASILNSSQAVETSVRVVRAFVQMQKALNDNRQLAEKISKLERKYDSQFQEVFIALRELANFSEDQIEHVILKKGVKE